MECRVKDVCDVRLLSELAFRLLGIKQIDGNMPIARAIRRLSPRQTNHLPIALLDEFFDDVEPDNTERTDNDRLFLHALPHLQGGLSHRTRSEHIAQPLPKLTGLLGTVRGLFRQIEAARNFEER